MLVLALCGVMAVEFFPNGKFTGTEVCCTLDTGMCRIFDGARCVERKGKASDLSDCAAKPMCPF